MPVPKFNLTQEFTLLALNSEGKIRNSVAGYNEMYFLAAAFMELIILKKISTQDNLVVIENASPTGISYLDELLETVQASSKSKKLKDWLHDLYIHNKIKVSTQVLNQLSEQKVLQKIEGKFLLVFPYTKYIDTDEDNEDSIVQKLRESILDKTKMTAYTMALSLLLDRSGILADFFSKYEQEKLKIYIKSLKEDVSLVSAVSKDMMELIQEVDSGADSLVTIIS